MVMVSQLIVEARWFWVENEMGLKTALEKLQRYGAQKRWQMARGSPLLEKLVAEGKGFASVGQA